MALKKLVTASQALRVNNLVVYLYGDPGIGKTSLAFTASRAILFDFDAGAHRAGVLRRGTTVPVEDWQDVANIEASDVADYDTIILDTAGRMLDLIKAHLVQNKNNRQTDGALKLKAQGYANEIFKNWIARIRSYGKDIVVLAHAAEDKKGDTIIIRPDVGGKNRNELYRQADLMGYLTEVDGDKGKSITTLNFKTNTAFHAKNSGGIGNVEMPELKNVPDFLASLIQQGKDHINNLTEEQVKDLANQDDLQNWKNDCELCNNAQDLNELLARFDKNHFYCQQMWSELVAKAKTLPTTFNKADIKFYDLNTNNDNHEAVTDPAQPAKSPKLEVVPSEQIEVPPLADLLNRVQNAQTEKDANALLRYTPNLDLKEVAQLRTAIGKRLIELQKSAPPKPTLADRMRKCQDSNELAVLSTEIELHDPAEHEGLWDIFTTRQNELEA